MDAIAIVGWKTEVLRDRYTKEVFDLESPPGSDQYVAAMGRPLMTPPLPS
jgi:hypothetical protein